MENKEEKDMSAWLRLKEVIDNSGMTVHAFAQHIGLLRSENLYQIKKGNHGISKVLAQTINRHFPEYSVGWLLTGEVFVSLSETTRPFRIKDGIVKRVPVYQYFKPDADPFHHLYISEEYINGADLAVINKDEAVSPKIPVGALVFAKQTKKIISGKLYLLAVSNELSIIRKVKQEKKSGTLFLSAIDRENYTDFELNLSEVKGLYSVEKIFTD